MKSSGRFFSFAIPVFFSLAGLGLTFAGLVLLFLGRMATAQLAASLLRRPDKLEAITTLYLTAGRFDLLVAVLLGTGLLAGLLAFFFFRNRHKLQQPAGRLASESRRLASGWWQEFQNLTQPQRLVLLGFLAVLLSLQLHFLWWFPAHTDEAFSYVFFVHKGLLTVVSYYPLPNNHVFYNVLCIPFQTLGLPPLAVMRLPTFLAAWAVALLLFGAVKKDFGFKAGFLALALFSAGVYSFYFTVHGRGYMLLTFFALVSGLAVLRFCQTRRKIFLAAFALASGLGFYTVPVFAYAFASMGLFGASVLGFSRNWVAFRHFFLAGLAAVVLTLLLYSPILLVSGFGAFYGNDIREIASQDFKAAFLPYLHTVPDNYWGLGAMSLFLPLLVPAGWLFTGNDTFSGKKLTILFLSWMALSLLIWIVVPQVLPPARTWLYWSLFVCWGLAMVLGPLFGSLKFTGKANYVLLLGFGLGWLAFETYSIKQKVRSGEIQTFWPLPPVIGEVLESPAQRVFAGHEYYDLMLQYEALVAGKTLEVDLYRFQPYPAYDYLFISRHKEFPAGVDPGAYQAIFRDHLITAYRLKGLLPEEAR